MVEDRLLLHFKRADAYRYNSESIRVRFIDVRFEALSREKRDIIVEQYLGTLPHETQRDMVTLFTFASSELERTPVTFREFLLNKGFEDSSPPIL